MELLCKFKNRKIFLSVGRDTPPSHIPLPSAPRGVECGEGVSPFPRGRNILSIFEPIKASFCAFWD